MSGTGVRRTKSAGGTRAAAGAAAANAAGAAEAAAALVTGAEATPPQAGAAVRRRAGRRGAAAPQAGGPTQPDEAWPAYFIPAALRGRLFTDATQYEDVRFLRGRRCGTDCQDDPAAVTVRRPLLTAAEWAELVQGLRAAQQTAPRGPEYWRRLRAALGAAARRLHTPGDSFGKGLLEALPAYTGYSRGMVAATLGSLDAWDPSGLTAALRQHPTKGCAVRWQKMPGLPGRVRFFPERRLHVVAGRAPVVSGLPLFGGDLRPRTVLTYGGDLPGDALSLLLLALSTTLCPESPVRREAPAPGAASAPLPEPARPPVVLARTSIKEPLLTPLMLSALEREDPEVVSMVACLGWDDGDERLLDQLLGEADLVMTAAGDGRAAPLEKTITAHPHRPRLFAHAEKLSFTAISREVLETHSFMDDQGWTPPGADGLIDVVALLASLDSAFWDQSGCLASRVHFVEKRGVADELPAEYARCVAGRLRQIAQVMPRGAWPVRLLHDPFDRYKAVEGSDRWGNGLRVISDYGDPFVVVLDERAGTDARPDPRVFASFMEECQTRVVLVRPVDDIMEVPWYYLSLLPRRSLGSIGLAAGVPGAGLTKPIRTFATACALRGVTSVRMVGQAALQHPAYSWDGLLPLDLVSTRPPGYFTTIEFDSPFEDMMATYRAHLARLAALPAGEATASPA